MTSYDARELARCTSEKPCDAASHSETISGPDFLDVILRRFPDGRAVIYVAHAGLPAEIAIEGLFVASEEA